MDKIVRGTVRDDGKIFAYYGRRKFGPVEVWMTVEEFQIFRERAKEAAGKFAVKRRGVKQPWSGTSEARARSAAWAKSNPERQREHQRAYRSRNRESRNAQATAWKKANPEKVSAQRKAAYVRRMSFGVERCKAAVRRRVQQALSYRKNRSSCKYLGCSYEFLRGYLEAMFEPWMTWDNFGNPNGDHSDCWHVDHIVPLSSAKTLEELIPLFHYTNLQPLAGIENIKKSNKT